MKKNIDDLLNDYIDNQLSVDEVIELKTMIINDSQIEQKLKALRAVHQSLQQLKTETAPTGFTERFMNKLDLSMSVSKKKNYFFFGVVGFFSFIIIGVITAIIFSVNWNFESMNLSSYIEQVKSSLEINGGNALSIFKNKTLLMISSTMVLLILIMAYFGFESHKNLKKKINSFSH